MRRLVIFLLLFAFNFQGFTQTGNEFWFAAPDVSEDHYSNSVPLNLHITAVHATTVTISRPADPGFTPLVYDLADQQTQTIVLSDELAIDEIEVFSAPVADAGFLQGKGFLIESDGGDVTAYYELDGRNNRDIFALKGMNALGKEFWVSTQRAFPNASVAYGQAGVDDCFSGFVIVATEPNTNVTVYTNGNQLEHYGATPAFINIPTMAAGQAFTIRAKSVDPGDHLQGIKIESNNNITVIVYDDSMLKRINAGGSLAWDIFGDQIVPVSLVGHDYISMKGDTYQSAVDGGERLCFTATENNTEISINGTPIDTIDAGEYAEWGGVGELITDQGTYIHCSKPTYVNHISGTADVGSVGGEVGGALLPTIDGCTGSNTVTIRRTVLPGLEADNYIVNLMVRVDASDKLNSIDNFTLTVGGISQAIPAAYFTFIADSAFAIYDRTKSAAAGAFFLTEIPEGSVARIDNPEARFHVGVMHGGTSNGCKYGYFSDYADNGARAGVGGSTAGNQGIYCSFDPIRLVADGGKSYQWYCHSHPELTARISDTTVGDPFFYPNVTGIIEFRVIVEGECFALDTLPLFLYVSEKPRADFLVSEDVGCSPLMPLLSNISDTVEGGTEEWIFETTAGNFSLDQKDTARVFPYQFPLNYSDSIQTHRIRLIVKAVSGTCASEKYKEVKVKPEITTAFNVSDTIGCHPLTIVFSDSSYGDTSSYYWDFGDFSQSFDRNTSHTFENYDSTNTFFDVELTTESPFGCLDSAIQRITVHPRIRTVMAIDTSFSCSPLNIEMDPGNSIGVDTFLWQILSPMADSVYSTVSYDPVSIYHQDMTVDSPDTILVNLLGINDMGCIDSFPQREIIVLPEVIAQFGISRDSICDGEDIDFINNSQGYELFHNWDFGDGSVLQDTTDKSYKHFYYNRDSLDDIAYTVRLTSSSAFFCEDVIDTIIIVHPFVQAGFGIDYENSCTPVYAEFSNLSLQADSYFWEFGDDSTSTDASSLFIHPYWNESDTAAITYNIQLIASNEEGCSDTLFRDITVLPHVVASFGMSDSVDCAPMAVSFTNNSTGGLSFLWDFGNGTSSTNKIPTSRTYTNYTSIDTTYFITLTALNSYGCDSSITDSIEVYALIDANFNLPLADSCSPFKLQPDNLSSQGTHFWDWNLLNTNMVSVESNSDSMPDLNLRENFTILTDTFYLQLVGYGESDLAHRACADTHAIQVLIYPELDIDFGLSLLADCQPLNSTITNNTNLPSGNSFEWVLNNTFYSSLRDPEPISIQNLTDFDQTQILWLSGVSEFGCRDTAQQSVTIYSLVDAQYTVNKAGICSADSFQIDRRTSRGGITTYEWDFGDLVENRIDTMFYYSYVNATDPAPVDQPIKLTVYNVHGCLDTITRNIDVYPEVRANFGVDINSFCYPHNSDFTNTTENADNYFWDFGDGSGSNDQIPEVHVFDNFDKVTDITYDIQLIARSQYNCYDSISDQVTVFAKPGAQFYFPVTVDCPPFNAQMINESQGFDPSYLWDFGDGNTSVDESPTNLFVNNGSAITDVPIKLTVTSGGAKACVDTAVRILRVYPNVLVDFQTSLTEGCSPLSVNFSGDTTNISSMVWDIDGLPFSTLLNTSYRFVNPSPNNESFDVTFRGTSLYNCTTDTSIEITVFPAPQAEFIPNPIVQPYNTELDQTLVTFFNQTAYQDNWTYEWNYGDGNTDNQTSAEFEYIYGDRFWGENDNGNEVPVSLITWNTNNPECRDSVSYNIQIKPPPPQVALEDDIAGCEPFTIDFASVVKYVYEDQMEWDFGEEGATTSGAAPVYTYEEQGTYTVRLQVNGEGGSSWAYRVITVHPKPEVNFNFNDSFALVTSQNSQDEYINFYNQTKFGNKYWWFFENNLEDGLSGSNSTEKDPSWHYENIGTYHAALVSMSIEGCYDTLVSTNAITIMGEASIQFPTGFIVEPSGPADEYVSDPMDPRRTIFRPYAKGVDEYKLEVYNRWGVLVFQSDDVNRGWNGYIDGIAAKQDVYIWRAKGRFTNGQPFEMSGDVTLIVAPDGHVPH